MGFAEGETIFTTEQICQVNGIHESALTMPPHCIHVDFQGPVNFTEDSGCIFTFPYHVHDQVFGPLGIPVIAAQGAFLDSQQALQLSLDKSRLGTDHFCKIRILFLRHDRGPGDESVIDADHLQVGQTENDQVLGDDAEAVHQHAEGMGQLGFVFPTGNDAVQRVAFHTIKPQ